MDIFLALVVFWIICGFAGASMLSRYNKGGTGCLLGGLLGPIGLTVAWTMRDSEKMDEARYESQQVRETPQVKKAERPMRKCPFCAEMILAEAKFCRYCQKEVEPTVEIDETEVDSSDSAEVPAIQRRPYSEWGRRKRVVAKTKKGRDKLYMIEYTCGHLCQVRMREGSRQIPSRCPECGNELDKYQ